MIKELRKLYIDSRIAEVDPDFLEFEEEMISENDIKLIQALKPSSIPNPHNSILLYVTGKTNEFDFKKARANTIGGAAPDIDVDFDPLNYEKIIEWLIDHWGREQVAHIIALQRFKPKSTVRSFFMATAPKDKESKEYKEHFKLQNEILDKIPKPLFGKEATLEEVIEGNSQKSYKPHPELKEGKYKNWYNVAEKLENMIKSFSSHAAGIVISDEPISNTVPVWFRRMKDKDTKVETDRWITQFDMNEIADLGLIKYDFLKIENLSIIKETCRLIEKRHGVIIDPDNLPQDDPKVYELINTGKLAGIFQMETSELMKQSVQKLQPHNLGELADLSALIRPGPLEAGFVEQYLENKQRSKPPKDLPKQIADLLANTYWVLCYQEQMMSIVSEVAGFTLKEADDIRRAAGKKNEKYLKPYREQFIKGLIAAGVSEKYATYYWDDVIVGFSNYGFNKSHAIGYALTTYQCAWLKTYYLTEFFAAIMTVRSKTISDAKKWSAKVSKIALEAESMNVRIQPPDINRSGLEFEIANDTIYFGLTAIKGIGMSAANKIIKSKRGGFKDILDFLFKTKANKNTFENLIVAGAFDSLGYSRQELLTAVPALQHYMEVFKTIEERQLDNEQRLKDNIEIKKIREELDLMKKIKRKRELTDTEQEFVDLHKGTREKKELLIPELPPLPELTRSKKLTISFQEMLDQGAIIGCFLNNPSRMIYPDTTPLEDIVEKGTYTICGVVDKTKTYKNRDGSFRHYLNITDGTDAVEIPITNRNKDADAYKYKVICAKVFATAEEIYDEDDNPIAKQLKVFKVYSIIGE